jgi:3-mercaptopyruvate sulfurtransferase SseA
MKSRTVVFSLIVFLVFGAGAFAQQSPKQVAGATTIDAAKAKELFDRGAKFVDVRPADLWREGRIPGAKLLDWGADFNEPNLVRAVARSDEVVIYCQGPG